MQENVPISQLTTMRLGGVAKYVEDITSADQVPAAYDFARSKNLPVYVLGSGSNVLGRDEGFDGLILLAKIKGIEIVSETDSELVLKAGAGEILDDLCQYTAERGCIGMEALSAVPGTVGAGPVQNVGAYGQEMSQVLVSVDVYDTKTGEFSDISAANCELSYRRSIFNTAAAGRYFITAVTVRVQKANPTPPFYPPLQDYLDNHGVTEYTPLAIREAVTAVRAAKLPDPKFIPSAGSFFKNVIVDTADAKKFEELGARVYTEGGKTTIPSGWLIEQAGLKGKVLHGMLVSDKAALILINDSAKNYADLAAARQEIIDTVRAKFGITLEQEPVEIA
jgi:UDP-N-acetylmuramate dehydrogenase